MSSPLSHADVCEKFAQLAISQRIPLFVGDNQEDIASYIAEYVKDLYLGDEYRFTVDPELYIKEAYQTLTISSFPWASNETEKRKASVERVTSKVSAMFFDAVNIYFMRCQVHESLLTESFSEAVNYFIKKDQPGVSPLQGPFTKVPSTFFGGAVLDFWDIEFPPEGDIAVIYTNEGFLRMILRYEGKVVRHY